MPLDVSSNNVEQNSKPSFLPKGKTVLVGSELFASLEKENLPKVLIDETQDPLLVLDDFLADPFPGYLIELATWDYNQAKKIAKAYPGETLYLLCPGLEPNENRLFPIEEGLPLDDQGSFDRFVSDLIGVPLKKKPAPKNRIQKREAPKKEEPAPIKEEKKEIPVPKKEEPAPKIEKKKEPKEEKPKPVYTPADGKISFEHERKILKNEALNAAFSLVFLSLSLATGLGYFYLWEGAGEAFRITCILMMALFPFMAMVPMGLLMDDLKLRRPWDSSFMMLSLAFVFALDLLFGGIILAVGFGTLMVPEQDVFLFGFLSFLTIPWTLLRLVFDRPLRAFFYGRKKKK